MIHTVILGADTPDAGELIRILAMHPDIELECAQVNDIGSRALSDLHHGLIGETDLATSNRPECRRCDMILDFSEHGEPVLTRSLLAAFPEAKVIRLNRCAACDDDEEWVYGVSEINRKALVRGARRALLPTSFASMALVALYPLALHMLLNSDINISIGAPEAILADTDLPAVEREIAAALGEAQRSFNNKVAITTTQSETRRSATMTIDIPCPIGLENIMTMYDMYDDHHFAFAVVGETGPSEVAGTEKCVISLSKPDSGTLHLESVADCRMRGGAGEAVHVLNLMCGLHERTGLALKAIDFHPL